MKINGNSCCRLQEHTARAFWHLVVANSDAVVESVIERPGLVALLKLAAPEVTRGAQLARQALRRLCEDPDVSSAGSLFIVHVCVQKRKSLFGEAVPWASILRVGYEGTVC